jgi:hypothetical protein
MTPEQIELAEMRKARMQLSQEIQDLVNGYQRIYRRRVTGIKVTPADLGETMYPLAIVSVTIEGQA